MHILEIAALVLCLHVLVVQSEVDLSKPLDSKIHEAIETNYTRLPHGVYLKAYSYMKNSKVFKNFTFEEVIEWIDNADKWDSPDLSRRFPYYLSGYDYEDRPIWIAEVGKYNVRKVVEKGSEGTADLERYTFQGVIRCLKSYLPAEVRGFTIRGGELGLFAFIMYAKDTDGKEVREIVIVSDWEGLDISQITHLPTVMFTLTLIRTYLDIASQAFGYAFAINVNYVAERGFDLLRPTIGGLFEKIEIYGSNKAKWKAALRRKLPEKSFPFWYGGSKDFKPLEVYG